MVAAHVMRSWLLDIWSDVRGPTGWRTVIGALASFGAVCGFLIALLTYLSSYRSGLIESAERSFSRFVDDMNSPSEQVRIAAIAQAPALLTRQVPTSSAANLRSALAMLIGKRFDIAPVYAPDVRRILHIFIKRGYPVSREYLETKKKLWPLRKSPGLWLFVGC
jgi:hypothetical protein